MAKIHSIVQNGEFYYRLALDQTADGDYTEAIKNLLQAARLSQKEKYYIELAETYFAVKAFRASTAVYISLFTKNPAMDYLLAISRNFIETGEEHKSAEFAFKTLMSYGKKLSEKRIARLQHIGEGDKLQKVFVKEEKPGLELINIDKLGEQQRLAEAYAALDRHDFDSAVRLSLDVKKDSPNYIQAQELICVSALANGDAELAINSARIMLNDNPSSMTAFRAFFEYKTSYIENEEYDEEKLINYFLDRLREMRDDELLRGFGILLYHYKKYDYLYKAMSEACLINGANDDNLFRMTLSAFIIGKKDEGKSLLNKLTALYPNDIRGKLLRFLAEEKTRREDWRRTFFEYPENRFDDFVRAFYKEFFTDAKDLECMTGKARDLLDIILVSEYYDVYSSLIIDAIKTGRKGLTEYLFDKLYDAGLPFDVRMDVLSIIIESGTEGAATILLDDRLVQCEIKDPRLPDKDFVKAYIEVFINLLNLGYIPSYRYLQSIMSGLCNIGSKYKKLNIICAVAHYYYNAFEEIDTDIKILAELYSTNVASIKKYLNIYSMKQKEKY